MKIVDWSEKFSRNKTRDINLVRYLVLHHTASNPNLLPEEIAYRSEKVIYNAPYHYLVYLDGRIYKMRKIGENGTCVAGRNLVSVCVAGVGDWEKSDPTTDQFLRSIAKLIAFLRLNYSWLEVVPHGRLTETLCPGKNFPFGRIVRLAKEYEEFGKYLRNADKVT